MEEHGANFLEPPPDIIEGEEEYEVEWILTLRQYGQGKKLQYLVRWAGYSQAHDSWEPADQVHAPELVDEFYQNNSTAARKIEIKVSSTPIISPSQMPYSPPAHIHRTYNSVTDYFLDKSK